MGEPDILPADSNLRDDREDRDFGSGRAGSGSLGDRLLGAGRMRAALPVAVVLGVLVVAGAFMADGWGIAAMRELRGPYGKAVAGWISHYGDFFPLMMVGLYALFAAMIFHRERACRVIVGMILAGMLAGGTANVVKSVAGRARPNAKVAPGWYGPKHNGQWLVGKNKFAAFPSGHTATAVGFFAVLAYSRRRLGPALLVLVPAVIIGFSRVYLGVHHLSDVVVAAMIGLGAALWLWRFVGSARWRAVAGKAFRAVG